MEMQGSFGYKIGRKIRLMKVEYDANILWQTCVREIYVLIKQFGSIDLLREAFEQLQEAKHKPSQEAIAKCKPYIDLTKSEQNIYDWSYLTRNCQHSFINILDSGYFLNNGEKIGYIFLLDFNTSSVRFYSINHEKKEREYDTATIDEIMEFDDMPTKTYTDIVTETKERAEKYSENIRKVDEEIERIQQLTEKAKELGATQHILQSASDLLREVQYERKKLESDYRYFYHRLDALQMITHDVA